MLSRATFMRLCRARARLCQIDDEPVRIGAIAREAGLSPFHFIRRFQAVFGETPHQYRIRARLEHARLLLAHGHESVTEVCLAVGFTSLGTFSDLFTRRVGLSPSAYRQAMRRAPQPPAGCLLLMGAAAAISEKRTPRSA